MSANIVVGKLLNPQEVLTEEEGRHVTTTLPEWQKRAMWSYLRLTSGRSIDDKIKAELKQGKDMKEVFEDMLQKGADIPSEESPKTLQFIIEGGEVKAVATLKHLLIPPDTVYTTVRKVLYKTYRDDIPLRQEDKIKGATFIFKEIGGLQIGTHIDGGSLTTRFAIRVSAFVRVELCFNPLSFLGVSGLTRFGIGNGTYERVLRIQKITELPPRLLEAIKHAESKIGDIETRVKKAKEVSLSATTGIRIMGTMCMAYGLGGKVMNEVFRRWHYSEEPTQWGLAMAESATAQHGEHRKESKGREHRIPQSLSTISGATLLLDDIKTSETKCRKWLQGQKSDLAENLLKGKLP